MSIRTDTHLGKEILACDRISAVAGVPPAKGWCALGNKAAHLRRRGDPSRHVVAKFSCGSWLCRVCAARKRSEAATHYGLKLLRADGVLFEMASDPATWDRDFKRLQRAKASWVRIGAADGPGVVFGAVPEQFGTAFSDAEAAIRRLGAALVAMDVSTPAKGKRCRPVNCSHDWKLPPREAKYERIGWVTVRDPGPVQSLLAGCGITPHLRRGESERQWDVWFALPLDRREEIEAALNALAA